jgi:hypothetical protein
MEITFDQLLELIKQAIIVIALLVLYKSVPVSALNELRRIAGEAADKTTTPADNLLLQAYDYFRSLVGNKEVLKPAVEEATVETPVYNPSENRD